MSMARNSVGAVAAALFSKNAHRLAFVAAALLLLRCPLYSQTNEEYHWGRDAGYFDEISGFTREWAGICAYVKTTNTDSYIQATLDKTLAAGAYRVLVRLYPYGTGDNIIEVDLNGTKTNIVFNQSTGATCYPVDIATTAQGASLKLTAKQIAPGATQLRIYSIWLSSNARDTGTWTDITLGPEPLENIEPEGNLLPGGSFETGLNDIWGKRIGAHALIDDNNLADSAAAPHGTKYLKLPWWRNRANKQYYYLDLCNRPVRVNSGGTFTVSAYLKASRAYDITLYVTACDALSGSNTVFSQQMNIGTAWQRYSKTFALNTNFTGSLQVFMNKTEVLASPTNSFDYPEVCVDAIHLARGTLQDYAAAYPSEAGVVIQNKAGAVFHTSDAVRLDLYVAGDSCAVNLAVVDANFQTIWQDEVAVAATGGLGMVTLTLTNMPQGAFAAVVQSLATNAAPSVCKAFSILDPREGLAYGLEAYFRMEEIWNGTSGDVADSSGNSHDGRSMNGACTTNFPQMMGERSAYFRYAGTPYLEFTDKTICEMRKDSFTMAAWLNTSRTNSIQCIFRKSGNGNYYMLRLQQNGTVALLVNEQSHNEIVYGTSGVNDASWHLVAGIFENNSIGNDVLSVWVDGVRQGVYYSAFNDINTSNGTFRIGYPETWGYQGCLDEAAIWKRALSAAEMTELYNGGVGKPMRPLMFDDYRAGIYGEITETSASAFRRAGIRFVNSLSVMPDIGRMSVVAANPTNYAWVEDTVDQAMAKGVEIVNCLSAPYPSWSWVAGKTYPTIAAWSGYVSNMVAHYQGRIKYWMVADEPSTQGIPADHYQQMVAATRSAVQAMDPAGLVIMHGDLPDYYADAIEAAGGSHAFYDILAAGANSLDNTAEQAETARAAGKEVWAIVFGSKDSIYDRKQTLASTAQWPILLCSRLSVLGATKFMNYDARISGSEPGSYRNSSSLLEFDGAFRPPGVSYAAAGNILNGYTPSGVYGISDEIECHVFEKDNGTNGMTVLWTTGPALECDIPASAFAAWDMYGNSKTMVESGGRMRFIVDSRPVFIGGPFIAITNALNDLAYNSLLKFTSIVEEWPPDGVATQHMFIRNDSDQAMDCRITLDISECWFAVAGNRRDMCKSRNVHVAAGGTGQVDFACLTHANYSLPINGYTIGMEVVNQHLCADMSFALGQYRVNLVQAGGFSTYPAIYNAGYPVIGYDYQSGFIAFSRDATNLYIDIYQKTDGNSPGAVIGFNTNRLVNLWDCGDEYPTVIVGQDGANAMLVVGQDETELAVSRVVREYPDCYTHVTVPLDSLPLECLCPAGFFAEIYQDGAATQYIGGPAEPRGIVLMPDN